MFRVVIASSPLLALLLLAPLAHAGDKAKKDEGARATKAKVEKQAKAKQDAQAKAEKKPQAKAEKKPDAKAKKTPQLKADKAATAKAAGKDDVKKKPAADKQAKAKKKPDGDKVAKADKKPGENKQPKANKKPGPDKAAKAKKPHGAAGVVKSIDATAKSITITKSNKKAAASEDKTFTIADDAKISVNGQPVSLADVPVGRRAKLTLSADGQKVAAIAVGGGNKKPKEKKPAV